MQANERLIVALDLPDRRVAGDLCERLRPTVDGFKVGLELFTAAGPSLVNELVATGARVFLDLKFHDIPNTVAGAARAATDLGVWMFNVHAAGGREMMRLAGEAAARAADAAGRSRPIVLAVTVLTSLDARTLREQVGIYRDPQDQVAFWALEAREAGLDGVVCSPREVARVRSLCGRGFVLVAPGVRPAGAENGDQRRVATPRETIAAGADYLVVGRPVTAAPDPAAAAERIVMEMAGASGNEGVDR